MDLITLKLAITMPEDGFVAYALKHGWEDYLTELEEEPSNPVEAMTAFAIEKLGKNILQDYLIEKSEHAQAAAMNVLNQAGITENGIKGAGIKVLGIEKHE